MQQVGENGSPLGCPGATVASDRPVWGVRAVPVAAGGI